MNLNFLLYISFFSSGHPAVAFAKQRKLSNDVFIIENDIFDQLKVSDCRDKEPPVAECESTGFLGNIQCTFLNFFATFREFLNTIFDFLGLPFLRIKQDMEKCAESIIVTKNVKVLGKLTIENLNISFSNGDGILKVEQDGTLETKNCTLNEISTCPSTFSLAGNNCLRTTFAIKSSKALSTCENLSERGSLAESSSILDARELTTIIPHGQKFWIASESNSKCSVINNKGAITSFDDDSCEETRPALCLATIASPISSIGMYSIENIDQPFLSRKELFKHLDDNSAIPLTQKGATVSYPSDEETDLKINPKNGNPSNRKILPNIKPIAVMINVELANGLSSDIKIASDVFGTSDLTNWRDLEDNLLPQKIQVHAEGDVCVKKLDLWIRDMDGNENTLFTISASSFKGCTKNNVCTINSEKFCTRSLMYYDESNECALLSPTNSKYPVDLSFDIFGQKCGILTTWHFAQLGEKFRNHASLGEEFVLHLLESNGTRTENITIEDESSQPHKYVFPPSSENQSSVALNSHYKLPATIYVRGGKGGRIKKIWITRYGETISSLDFVSLHDCINLCDQIASEEGLFFNNVSKVDYASFDLLNDGCDKIVAIATNNVTGFDDTTGTEACTDPVPKNISSLGDITTALESIQNASSPYRSVKVSLPDDGLSETGSINIEENRGLIFQNESASEKAVLNGLSFIVPANSELYFSDVSLTGSSRVVVQNQGYLNVAESLLHQADPTDSIIENSGKVDISQSNVTGDAFIRSNNNSSLILSRVTFSGNTSLDSDEGASIQVSNIHLYDSFVLDSNVDIGLTDRYFVHIDDDDPLCTGNEEPSKLLPIDPSSCKSECQDDSFCFGSWSYFFVNETTGDAFYQCGLCLKEEGCAFNCTSEINSYYLQAKSNVDYTKASGCLFETRSFQEESNLTLEKCKIRCSLYENCEGVGFDKDQQSNSTNCTLYANMDIQDCNTEDEQNVYLPFSVRDSSSFQNVSGKLASDTLTTLGMFMRKAPNECSAICKKTLGCMSFVISGDNCTLYDDRTFDSTTGDSNTYIFAGDLFPKKRYMKYAETEFKGSPMVSTKAKTEKRCQDACDGNPSCLAYSFEDFSHDSANCILYDKTVTVDGSEDNSTNVHVAYVYDAYIIASGSKFVEKESIPGILLKQCKAICMSSLSCEGIQYITGTSTQNQTCLLGELSTSPATSAPSLAPSSAPSSAPTILGGTVPTFAPTPSPIFVPTQNKDNILVIASSIVDQDNAYRSTRSCLDGSSLAKPQLFPEETKGYTQLKNTCTSTPLSSNRLESIVSPTECANECNKISGCYGFEYYIDNGGDVVQDFGSCTMLSNSTLELGSCDGVDSNTDLYLRGDVGLSCEGACNLDPSCQAYVFDDEIGCNLYTDIALRSINVDTCNPRVVNIKQNHRSQGASMVEASNQCTTEVEDTQIVGCFGPFDEPSDKLYLDDSDEMTLQLCQSTCQDNNLTYYGIHEGRNCYCFEKTNEISNYTTGECGSPCSGDSDQNCGSSNTTTIGRTNLPLLNVTFSQCKEACTLSTSCASVVFDDSVSPSTCKFHDLTSLEECPAGKRQNGKVIVKGHESFYSIPDKCYVDYDILLENAVDSQSQCTALCNSFPSCDAIRFKGIGFKGKSCQLLGDGKLDYTRGCVDNEIFVKRSGHTFAVFPESKSNLERSRISSKRIAAFDKIFHFDDCSRLCYHNEMCSSVVFDSGIACELYSKSNYYEIDEKVNVRKEESAQRHVDHRLLYELDPQFSKVPSGFCIQTDSGTSKETSSVVKSNRACEMRCSSDAACSMVSFDENATQCVLYYGTSLGNTGCSQNDQIVETMKYSPGAYVDTTTSTRTINRERIVEGKSTTRVFNDVSLVQCSAMCKKWHECKSFSLDQLERICTLSNIKDQDFEENTEDFIPIAPACLDNLSQIESISETEKEACITFCKNILGCMVFEHSADGVCALYDDSLDECGNSAEDSTSTVYLLSTAGSGRKVAAADIFQLTENDDEQYQMFLSANAGAPSQSLLSLTGDLYNKLEDPFLTTLTNAQDAVSGCQDIIETIATPVNDLKDSCDEASDTLKIFYLALLAATYVQ